MIYKILGLVLILPMLTILLAIYGNRPVGISDFDLIETCFFVALILEAYAVGIYLLFK